MKNVFDRMKLRGLLRADAKSHWTMADQALVSAVNFVTTIILVRFLGLDVYGQFALAWLVVLILGSVHHAAVAQPMMSLAPSGKPEERAQYFGAVHVQSIIVLCLLGGLGLAVALLISRFSSVDVLPSLAAYFVFAGAAFQFQDFLRRCFFVQGRYRRAFFFDLLAYGGQVLGVMLLFFFWTPSLEAVLWVIGGASVIPSALMMGLGRIRTTSCKVQSVFKEHWVFSRWLVGSTLLNFFTVHWFVFAAGLLLGPAAAGILRAAENATRVLAVFLQALENLLPVEAAQYFHSGGVQGLIDYLKKQVKQYGLLFLVVALIFILFAEFWLSVIYGQALEGYSDIFIIYTCVQLAGFGNFICITGYRTLQNTRVLFYVSLGSVIFNVAWTVCVLPIAGLVGAAFGLLLARVFVFVMLSVLLWHYIRKRSG